MDAPQDEEAQLAATLAALEAKASRHITDLFSSTLDNRSAFNAQLTQIRDDLAALRAATRDLAILTEEQDTYAAAPLPASVFAFRLIAPTPRLVLFCTLRFLRRNLPSRCEWCRGRNVGTEQWLTSLMSRLVQGGAGGAAG